jgi:hypothetical protein
VHRGITTSKSEYTTDHTNKERKTLRGKLAQIQELGENFMR